MSVSETTWKWASEAALKAEAKSFQSSLQQGDGSRKGVNKLVMTGGEVANCVRAMVMTCAGADLKERITGATVEPKLRLDARRVESSSKENWEKR